ncbi:MULTISPECIES: hypothetical protein [Actinoplanes]|uniref:hypothetical protein n=1 Tax=Actinoplanes TaxID=1865 RepID=UPI0005F2FAD3|nr:MULTISPECIES: hypothetical protein [Actinoplanes]
MERLASVSSLATSGGSGVSGVGMQIQLRVDYVVNRVMETHRGMAEDQVKQAIQEGLRGFGVVPNKRQVDQYAAAISSMPQLPPSNG